MRIPHLTRAGLLGSIATLSWSFASQAAAADHALPWVFTNGSAKGYSIRLQSADPAPGTVIFVGQSIEFKITVSYQLSIADQGSIVLVVQDRENKSLLGQEPQTSQTVSRGTGTVTLMEHFEVPSGIGEVRLFIPLVPNGVQHTDGELVLRYPVGKETQSSTIGYKTVAAALADLHTTPGVEFTEANGWTIAVDRSHFTVWSFSPLRDPSYPSAVKRSATPSAAGSNLNLEVLCEASKSACDKLVLDFQALNQRALGSLKSQ
jgi:hypothetical protein